MPRRQGLKVVPREGTTALYLRGTVRGQRVFESTGTDDPNLAEERRATREAELYRAAIHGTRPRVTFASAALDYGKHESRSNNTKIRVGKLIKYFGPNAYCDEIDQARIDKAARTICRIGAKPATKLREVIGPAKAVLHHAAFRGWCNDPKFEPVKGASKRTDWLTPDEAEAQIAAASNPNFQTMLVLFYCTGARVDEALGLDWKDVNLQHARAIYRDTKNGGDRIVDLPPRAVVALANLPHRVGAVFLHHGKPYRRTNDSSTSSYGGQIRSAWGTSIRNGGITKKVTPHHARHTWASWYHCVHRDLLKLREDGGWKSISQVERYAKVVPHGFAPAIQGFWGTRANVVHPAAPIRTSA